jgi:hypothetical protein
MVKGMRMMDEKFFGHCNMDTLKKVFLYCHQSDVERGGIFDGRSAAVNIYTRPWKTPQDRAISQLVGTFSVNWLTGEVSIQEDSSQSLTRWIFQYLVGLAEEERLPPPLQDQSEVVYRMELQQAERELVIKDLSAIGRASPRGEVLLDFLEQKSQ